MMSEDDKIRIKTQIVIDDLDNESPLTVVPRHELAHLRQVEALARAVTQHETGPIAGNGEHCVFCGGTCALEPDGTPYWPTHYQHRDNCPWAQLRAALGEGDDE
jgi:hypothetical protein